MGRALEAVLHSLVVNPCFHHDADCGLEHYVSLAVSFSLCVSAMRAVPWKGLISQETVFLTTEPKSVKKVNGNARAAWSTRLSRQNLHLRLIWIETAIGLFLGRAHSLG